MATDPISPQQLDDALANVVDALAGHNTRYAVIGGMATGFRTQPRFTKDVDFLISIPQLSLPAVLQDLERRGFTFDTIDTIREWTQHHMAVLSYQSIRVDWLKPVLPIYEHILDRATDEPWMGRPIRIASPEGLILLKLIAFRPQDQLDIQSLILSYPGTLDLDWIRAEWQTIADLEDPRMKRFEAWLAGTTTDLA